MLSNNGINHIEDGINTGKTVGIIMGVLLFGVSIYAFGLSIKANRLAIKKLNDEGYK